MINERPQRPTIYITMRKTICIAEIGNLLGWHAFLKTNYYYGQYYYGEINSWYFFSKVTNQK